MKKILFLHGFFASGQCQPALALREAFEGKAEVISPDLPTHPKEALALIRDVIDSERPDVLVGNSCGSFYAQIVAPVVGIPALLGNPHFHMTEFLCARVGRHEYKSKRLDGKQDFTIDELLIAEFAEIEDHQYDCCNPYYTDKVWGIFGEQDTLAKFEPLFLEHYNRSFHFPGAHTPSTEEVKIWYAPLVEKLMMEYPVSKDGYRYFRHFKGGLYRYIHSAFNSETQERMVVYQALYGDGRYWVRPERMFFETVERDGLRCARFSEIDKDFHNVSTI